MTHEALSLGISGMSCNACSQGIERMLNKQEHIYKAEVFLISNSANVEFDSNKISKDIIIALIAKMGYYAYELDNIHILESSKRETNTQTHSSNIFIKLLDIAENKILTNNIRLIASIISSIFILYISMLKDAFNIYIPYALLDNKINALLQLAITLIVMHFGRGFFLRGFKAILHKNPNMDSLVALGSSAGFLYSLYVLLIGVSSGSIVLHNLYFEGVCVILTFVMIGKNIEYNARDKALSNAKKLLSQENTIIYKILDIENVESSTKEIDIDSILKGDYLKIMPHSFVPVDGIMISNQAFIDESNLSGESLPISKLKGDKLLAGTINTDSAIIIQAISSNKDSTLAKLHHLISQCLASKAKIATLADRISGIFVPVVIALACISALFWLYESNIQKAVLFFASTLLISCPCALGLATPMAILFANARANKRGIFFKNAESLERIAQCDIVLFDKTGTLTNKHLDIHNICIFTTNASDFLCIDSKEGQDIYLAGLLKDNKTLLDNLAIESPLQLELLKIVASIESYSNHIIAENINKLARGMQLYKVITQRSIINQGMEANLQTQPNKTQKFSKITSFSPTKTSFSMNSDNNLDSTFILGSKDFILSKNLLNKDALTMHSDSGIEIYIARHRHASNAYMLLGRITLQESIKEHAKELIAYLKQRNIKSEILSGDREGNVERIANILDIAYKARCKPEDKMTYIKQLQEKHHKVIMVGDGSNDSVAISSANVSIVMSSGSDISINHGDIIYFNTSLLGIKEALLIGEYTLKRIKENLAFAFIYNVICIPIAMGLLSPFGIYLNPMFASFAMSAGSISVVLNAARIYKSIH